VALVALGDADAVPVGDYHLKDVVAWNLAGRPRGTDDEMLDLLEPYRGHRGRVIRLLTLAGDRPPKYGPRMEVNSIAGL
jgi:3-methyladenine DNA glycosylase/8-oxoguanine DNA glycosylase